MKNINLLSIKRNKISNKIKNLDITKTHNIFFILLIGKILFFPFVYLIFALFDNPSNLFILGDLVGDYEKWERLRNLFKFGEWSMNYGFRSIVFFIYHISPNNFIRFFIHALISLSLMCIAQTMILKYIFEQKKDSPLILKSLSILGSIANFYILIFSFKPSPDVFGCIGISLIIIFYERIISEQLSLNKFRLGFIFYLILCFFRNTLFLCLPFMFLNKKFRFLFYKTFFKINKSNLTKFSFVLFFIVLNIFQFGSYFASITSPDQAEFMAFNNIQYQFSDIAYLLKNFFIRCLFLISVRERIGMDYFLYADFDFFTLKNILPSLFLFLVNLTGLISIFRVFKSNLKQSFLFSLIPVLPVLSFVSHHRYFLPYSIITTAALPFLFDRKKLISDKA